MKTDTTHSPATDPTREWFRDEIQICPNCGHKSAVWVAPAPYEADTGAGHDGIWECVECCSSWPDPDEGPDLCAYAAGAR